MCTSLLRHGGGGRGRGRREAKQGWSLLENSFLAVNPSSNRGSRPLPGVALEPALWSMPRPALLSRLPFAHPRPSFCRILVGCISGRLIQKSAESCAWTKAIMGPPHRPPLPIRLFFLASSLPGVCLVGSLVVIPEGSEPGVTRPFSGHGCRSVHVEFKGGIG